VDDAIEAMKRQFARHTVRTATLPAHGRGVE
jgi:hypothetical protein